MKMVRFIHSLLLFIYISNLFGQDSQLNLKDSFDFETNEIYIDRLNQIYIFPVNSTSIYKLNDDKTLNQKYSNPFISKYVFMDVKDPMKLLVYLPQFNNVNIYDESLFQISDEYFVDFNAESAICFHSSTQLCYFSLNKIHIKNISDKSTKTSEQLFYERKNLNNVSQIKSNGNDIYLLLPGIGLWHFNAFLNLESFIEDYRIERIELLDDKLYYLKENKIYQRNEREFKDKIIYESSSEFKRFAMNKNYLLIALKSKILRFYLPQ